MSNGSPRSPERLARRTSLLAAKLNGLGWSIGNGLLGSTLVLYVASEVKSQNLALSIGMILAWPKLVGLLRLAAPAMIGRFAGRPALAIAAYALSVLCLIPLPLAALEAAGLKAAGQAVNPESLLATIVAAWCAYHVCEYIGTVALFSTLGDLLAPRVRGRFWASRERWMLIGNLTAMAAGAVFNEKIGPHYQLTRGQSLAATCVVGMIFFALAIAPLLWFREPPRTSDEGNSTPERTATPRPSLLAPLGDRRFVWWLLTGGWISVANGLTNSAQFICYKDVLGITFAMRQQLEATLRLGQLAVAGPVGQAIDRWGTVRTLMTCQALTAAGLLFLACGSLSRDFGETVPKWLAWIPLLTPAAWWLPTLATNPSWFLWIAFAGHNVGLPTLTVNLAPRGQSAAYFALYLAWADFCFAVSALVGGALMDAYGLGGRTLWSGGKLSFLSAILLVGFGLRMLALVGLRGVAEPPFETPGTGPAQVGKAAA